MWPGVLSLDMGPMCVALGFNVILTVCIHEISCRVCIHETDLKTSSRPGAHDLVGIEGVINLAERD